MKSLVVRAFAICFVVSRPRFDFLAESDQKTLKVGIPCLTFSIYSLVVSLGKVLSWIASTFEW